MDRRGIVLENIVGIILAIAGAVLLAFMAAGIYQYVFPAVTLAPSTQGTAQELVTYAEHWRENPSSFASAVIPMNVEKDEVLVFFGKDEDAVRSLSGVRIPKPAVKQCRLNACVCGYQGACAGFAERANVDFSKLPLLKCWELRGINDVLMPKFYDAGQDAWGAQASAIGRMTAQEELTWMRPTGRPAGFLMGQIYGSDKGVRLDYLNWYRRSFVPDLQFAHPFIGNCKSASNIASAQPLYLEKQSLPSGESILFMTLGFNLNSPQLAGRRDAFARYVQSVQSNQ